MIEWRWDLKRLTIRDQAAANLAGALDFKQEKGSAALRGCSRPVTYQAWLRCSASWQQKYVLQPSGVG